MTHVLSTFAVVLLAFLAGLLCAGTRHPSGPVSGMLFLAAALIYGLFCMS